MNSSALIKILLGATLLTSCSSGGSQPSEPGKDTVNTQDTMPAKISGKEDEKRSLPDTAQLVMITAPKTGEKLIKGSTYKIRWSTSPSFDSAYPQVMITLITAKGQQGVGPNQQIITKNTGSVEWTVPIVKLKGDIQSGDAQPYVTRELTDQDEFQFLIEGYPHITGRAEGPFDYSDGFWIVSH